MEKTKIKMNKEKTNQTIETAYNNYLKNCLDRKWMKGDFYFDGTPRHHLYLREEFINKCKTDPEFSEKWGLKIEERELSLEERWESYFGKKFNINRKHGDWEFLEVLAHHNLNEKNVPTKLITLTYNNETIESYE